MKFAPLIAAAAMALFAAPALAAGTGLTIPVANGSLAATFYPAAAAGRSPAIVLLSGSGKGPRDNAVFRELERRFNALGIGVLAYDKRDETASLHQLAADGIAAVEYLRSRADVDPGRIGVWGISQGGNVGPLMATMSCDVSFVISVSGPGVSIAEQAIYFRRAQMREQGFSPQDVDEAADYRRVTWAYFGTGIGREAAEASLAIYRDRPWFAKLQLPRTLASPEQLDPGLRAFMQEAASYDPLAVAAAVRVPILLVFGAKDSIVPVTPSLQNLIETYGRVRGNRASFALIPNAGHGMELVSSATECHECSEKAFASGHWEAAPGFFETMSSWLARTLQTAPPSQRP